MSSESLDEVNAAELNFGSDFNFDESDKTRTVHRNHAQVLCNDEVYYLMNDSRIKDIAKGEELSE